MSGGRACTSTCPSATFRVTRADLIRYAGASGDFNPIHWSDRLATAVGLPGVIAHGLLTMALVGRALTGWAGNPAGIVDFNVRFTRPVVVPDTDEGAELVVTGRVAGMDRRGVRGARPDRDVRWGQGSVPGSRDRPAELTGAPRPGVPVGKSWSIPVHWSAVGPVSPGRPRQGHVPRRGVAQLVAQRSPKPQVAGSSPVAPAGSGTGGPARTGSTRRGILVDSGFNEQRPRLTTG